MSARGRVAMLRFQASVKHKKWDLFWGSALVLAFVIRGEYLAAILLGGYAFVLATTEYTYQHEIRVLRTALEHAKRSNQ